MKRISTLSLKAKIFFSTVAVVLVISVLIAFVARWVLISSLTQELEQRGKAVAHSVAEGARGYILDNDTPQLVTLIFDAAQLGERKRLVSYIYLTDVENNILAHTFTRPFPLRLAQANILEPGRRDQVTETTVFGQQAYDIAVPINEGIYQIGSVHVGLNKEHIDRLVGKLRITFLGFIGLIILIIFLISLRLANYIISPLAKLTRISDELSRGNFDITLDFSEGGDELAEHADCPAYKNTDLPCWHFDQTLAAEAKNDPAHQNLRTCSQCRFYRKHPGDEVVKLADSFRNMVWSIKLYRRRLRESEEKYRSLFDSGPDPVFVVDYAASRILDANPRAQELYGFTKDELIGKDFTDLAPGFLNECVRRLEGTGESSCVYCAKVLHYKKDREPFYVNLHACPISYKGHHAIIIAVTDVTEMIEKDAQLIQASKMKTLGEMSAGIAHELNQPLNAIKMGSEFLIMSAEERGCVPIEHLQDISGEISIQVDRATEIINTLRAFGRKADLMRERLNVNRSIQGVMNIVGQQLRLQNIEVRLSLQEDLPLIMAHDNRLQQVLFNLVTNARDAIAMRGEQNPEGNLVLIESFARDGRVGISVTDNGIGIPEAERDKVFEPFYTTKETGQGMGLGLSISYGIVRDYGGEIGIESREGVGTTFTLSFPAVG